MNLPDRTDASAASLLAPATTATWRGPFGRPAQPGGRSNAATRDEWAYRLGSGVCIVLRLAGLPWSAADVRRSTSSVPWGTRPPAIPPSALAPSPMSTDQKTVQKLSVVTVTEPLAVTSRCAVPADSAPGRPNTSAPSTSRAHVVAPLPRPLMSPRDRFGAPVTNPASAIDAIAVPPIHHVR